MENQREGYENNVNVPEGTDVSQDSIQVETVEFEGCARHNNLPFVGDCLVCGKKLCRECRAERGYFCSDECLQQSKSTVDQSAREEFRKTQASTEKIVKIFTSSSYTHHLFTFFK